MALVQLSAFQAAPLSTPGFDVRQFLLEQTRSIDTVSEQDIDLLVNQRDSKMDFLFPSTNQNLVYQLLGLLHSIGGKNTVEHVQRFYGNDIYAWITWMSPAFKAQANTEYMIREALQTDIKPILGLYECRKCKKKNTTALAKQTMRADEETSVFVTCLDCDHKFHA